jgi:hypothetical protein
MKRKVRKKLSSYLEERDWMLKDFLVLLSAKGYKLKEIANLLTQRWQQNKTLQIYLHRVNKSVRFQIRIIN